MDENEYFPIDIQVKDNWRFSQVAFLVDRDDFISDIAYRRTKLKVPADLIPRNRIDYWSELTGEFDVPHSGFNVISTKLLHRYPIIEQFILDMLKKYNKSTQFHNVIKNALLSGIITEDDLPFVSAHLRMIDQEEYARMYIAGIYIPTEMALILTPETRLEDVTKAYKKYFRNYSQSYKRHLLENYGAKTPKTMPSIRDARRWYWSHKWGEGYASIAHKEIMNNNPNINPADLSDTVRIKSGQIRKAILRYQSSLKASSFK